MFNNKKAVRTQVDNAQDAFSEAAGLSFEGSEDKTRPEFAEEADLNAMLGKFGVGAMGQREVKYGMEIDYTQDLQGAFEAIKMADTAHSALPRELRDMFPTTASFLEGAASGTLERAYADLKAREAKAEEEKRRQAIMEEQRTGHTAEGAKAEPPKSDKPA